MSAPESVGRTRRLALILSLATLAFGAPVAYSPQGLAFNDACAEGTCCPEENSICNIGGGDHEDYYKKSEGSCGGNPGGPTCCPEVSSICNGGGMNYNDYYYISSGECP